MYIPCRHDDIRIANPSSLLSKRRCPIEIVGGLQSQAEQSEKTTSESRCAVDREGRGSTTAACGSSAGGSARRRAAGLGRSAGGGGGGRRRRAAAVIDGLVTALGVASRNALELKRGIGAGGINASVEPVAAHETGDGLLVALEARGDVGAVGALAGVAQIGLCTS